MPGNLPRCLPDGLDAQIDARLDAAARLRLAGAKGRVPTPRCCAPSIAASAWSW